MFIHDTLCSPKLYDVAFMRTSMIAVNYVRALLYKNKMLVFHHSKFLWQCTHMLRCHWIRELDKQSSRPTIALFLPDQPGMVLIHPGTPVYQQLSPIRQLQNTGLDAHQLVNHTWRKNKWPSDTILENILPSIRTGKKKNPTYLGKVW